MKNTLIHYLLYDQIIKVADNILQLKLVTF